MERFFSAVKKFNSIVLLVCLLFLLGWYVSDRWSRRQYTAQNTVEVPAQEGGNSQIIQLSLSKPDRVVGWPLWMSRFESRPKGKFESSSSSYDDGSLRNILFIYQDEAKATWLFDHHRNYISSIEQVGLQKACATESSCTSSATRALFLSYAKQDTNKDQRINYDDEHVLAMALPDGTGMVDLLQNVDNILTNELIDEKHYLIVYQKNKKVYYVKISVPEFNILINKEIVSIPGKM